MVVRIESAFPRLQGAEWSVSSEVDDVYNCVAWAAGSKTNWWWPVGTGKTYWPEGAPRELTLEAFRDAFATLGFRSCANEDFETGFEKVALFADDRGIPRHAARQLENGRWTSKLGRMEDVEHALRDLEGTAYGSVVLVMKRRVN